MIPDEELSKPLHFNFAPMVDFLFLIVDVFAIALAMKTSLLDSDISLVKTKNKIDYSSDDKTVINVSISPYGNYQWITDYNQYPIESPEALSSELKKQKEAGILPENNDLIAVLVHIDKTAPWEPIAKLLIEMKKEGYPVHPVYEGENQ
jgi:biopolymer transport protein ExbD